MRVVDLIQLLASKACKDHRAMAKIQRALISLTDKAGIGEFAQGLSEFGIEIISTGGTARALREAGVQVRDVSEVTGFPEMLDGRVKTIHPRIAGGILAIRGQAEHMQALADHDIPTIDMVVVNLYAFDKAAAKPGVTVPELIENIDIGGPTLIRAAAKNYQDVAVIVSPEDYETILDEMRASGGRLSPATRWQLARKAFRLTADYDRAISARLARIDVGDGRFEDRRNVLPPFWTCSPTWRFRCAMARIRTSRPLCTRTGRAASQAPNNFKGRNCPTTTWWIWTPPGSWFWNSLHPPPLSSSTPTLAAAPKAILWRRVTDRLWPAIRSRPTAACWPSTGRSTKKRPWRFPRPSWRPSRLPSIPPRRWRSWRPRRTFACFE